MTEPTCNEGGFTTYTCHCGYSCVSNYTGALGHDYVDGSCTGCGEAEPGHTENPFTDVTSGSYYYEPVLWAVENGITNGTSATTFGANDPCQRAHVVVFLWRAMGCPEPTRTDNPFVDVKSTDSYYKAVMWAVEKGITKGMTATEFGPNGICNHGQIVTFLYRTYN